MPKPAMKKAFQASGDEGGLGVEAGHIDPWQKTSRPQRTVNNRKGFDHHVQVGAAVRQGDILAQPAAVSRYCRRINCS
jgi:hypothetical protein